MKKNKQVTKAVGILQNGGVIIFPTDTVWGIGASLKRPQAIEKLYQIKKRKKAKPTAVLVNSVSQAEQLGKITSRAKNMMQKYWPGGLTIIVKAKQKVPQIIQGEGKTVGLRMPDNQLVLEILEKLGTGIVAASANFSGEPMPKSREMIDQRLIDLADQVVEGKCYGRRASTVIDVSQKSFKILRQGLIDLFQASSS